MMKSTQRHVRHHAWMLGTAAAVALCSGAAFAQGAGDQLEQVTVTATRTTSTVNQVALSVTAVTQADLDQQGISTFNDLLTAVPGLIQTLSLGTGLTNVSIRGLSQGGQGAATTGFYIDDVPIQTRDVGGNGGSSTNGTPLPPIFDLQRIEVLRGPQGTLYGASSEGGTIRYITPAPSLDSYSVYAKADVNSVDYGSTGYSLGIALGGPIVTDKVGYRVSAYWQHIGGYLDVVDPFTLVTIKDTNPVDAYQVHATILAKPSDNTSITFSTFLSKQTTPNSSGPDYSLSTTATVTVPEDCYLQPGPPGHEIAGPTGTVNLVASGAAACDAYKTAHPTLPVFTDANILAAEAAAEVGTNNTSVGGANPMPAMYIYDRSATVVAPVTLTPYQSLDVPRTANNVASTEVAIVSLNMEYDFSSFSAQLLSSYFRSLGITHSIGDGSYSNYVGNENATYGSIAMHISPWLVQQEGIAQNGRSDFVSRNLNQQNVEELRFTSTDMNSPWQWVAGVYFNVNTHPANFFNTYDGGPNVNGGPDGDPVFQNEVDQLAEVALGITGTQRWKTQMTPFGFNRVNFATEIQSMRDTIFAGYGQMDYKPDDHWDFTLGLRQSYVHFTYYQAHFGPVTGLAEPNYQNASESVGVTSAYPTNPKFGVKFNFDPTKFVYFSASKGFRPGGVNGHTTQNICGGTPATATTPATGLAFYGLTADDLPTTYAPDSDWSYEAGTKLGLFNGSVQVNADVYRIDWNDVQTTQTAGHSCGLVFTANAGSARSQGLEVDAQARLFGALTANASFEYDDAQYTSDAVAVHGRGGNPDLITAFKGQKFAIPPWSLSAGLRYDLVFGDYNPYVRVDYRVQAPYDLSQFGLGSFNIDSNHISASTLVNLRAGLDYGNYDINAYATNLFNNDRYATSGGRSGCADAACTLYQSYSLPGARAPFPRTFGLQLVYRQ